MGGYTGSREGLVRNETRGLSLAGPSSGEGHVTQQLASSVRQDKASSACNQLETDWRKEHRGGGGDIPTWKVEINEEHRALVREDCSPMTGLAQRDAERTRSLKVKMRSHIDLDLHVYRDIKIHVGDFTCN